MRSSKENEKRVLAIDPSSKGLGFAVMEGPSRLVDWGVRVATENKNERWLKLIDNVMERYRPAVVLAEDCLAKGSRRSLRIRELIDETVRLSASKKIRAKVFSRRKVRAAFSKAERISKHRIAIALAERFPELTPHLPPPPKPWLTEHYRLQMFNAVSLGVTFFENRKKRAIQDNHL